MIVPSAASEFDLIDRYFARSTPQAVLGPGDDCALLSPRPGTELAITTDMLVCGTHFFPDAEPGQLGWKTLAVNLSDLAAMGATPRWALLAGSLPDADENWLSAFAEGLFSCAKCYGVDLVGGDTTRGPLNLCVTALGEVPAGAALRRSGGRAGDDIWVSGQPGLAALGLAQLKGRISMPEGLASRCLLALHHPEPRVALGQALLNRQLAHAAIDVSDGLLADLGHIAKLSGLVAEVLVAQLPALPAGAEAALARDCQLSGGDDYELVFSATPGKRHELTELARQLDLPLWRIGRLTEVVGGNRSAAGEVRVVDEGGRTLPTTRKGFDHFA